MFFSNTHWSQLNLPFYSILFEISICQFSSSKLSPLLLDEVRKHPTRDQRPFLHPESLQILQIPCSMLVLLLFSSSHSFYTGFRSEDWKDHSRSLVLCSVPIFVLFLRFVFGLFYGWKIQTWLIIRFLPESVTCWFFYLLVFERIHDTMYLNKMSRTSSRSIGPQHQKYSSIFNCTHGVLFIPVFTKPILSVFC